MVVCSSTSRSLLLRSLCCGPVLTISLTFVTTLALWSSLTTAVCAGLVSQAVLANPISQAGIQAAKYPPGHLGAVASESSICSDIGIELLKQGGNAADAVST